MLITLEFLENWNFEIELPVEVRTKQNIDKYNKHKNI